MSDHFSFLGKMYRNMEYDPYYDRKIADIISESIQEHSEKQSMSDENYIRGKMYRDPKHAEVITDLIINGESIDDPKIAGMIADSIKKNVESRLMISRGDVVLISMDGTMKGFGIVLESKDDMLRLHDGRWFQYCFYMHQRWCKKIGKVDESVIEMCFKSHEFRMGNT